MVNALVKEIEEFMAFHREMEEVADLILTKIEPERDMSFSEEQMVYMFKLGVQWANNKNKKNG